MELKNQMQLYSMSELGLLSYYLGMEVKQSQGSIEICQAAKIFERCRHDRL